MAEKVETAGLKNFIRLEVLMTQACTILRRFFKERWEHVCGEEWVNSPTSGSHFIFNLGNKPYQKADQLQRKALESGDINNWDLTTLALILLEVEFGQEDTKERGNVAKEKSLIRELVDIRNTYSVQKNMISSEEFHTFWQKVLVILLYFGYDKDKVEKFCESEEIGDFDIGTTHFLNPANVEESNRLKEEGNKDFQVGNMDKALQHYTAAINLSDISNQVLGTLYSNRAAIYIREVEKLRLAGNDEHDALEDALRDAQNAVHFRPNWWKAHFRLGSVFEIMGEQKKAVFAFECAVVLNPLHKRVKAARDNCLRVLAEGEIRESLCPTRLQHELLHEGDLALESHVKKLKENEKIFAKIGHPKAYVLEAHRLRYGLDDGQPKYEKAAPLYEKAASKGNAEAMFHFAMMTKDGLGVKKNIKRGVHLLKTAANEPSTINGFPNLGVAEAEYEIGILYIKGEGVSLNLEIAIEWMKRASEHGIGGAADILGKVYVDGMVMKRDVKRGLDYWKLAASRKYIPSMEALYEFFLEEENPEQAKKWFREALENGSSRAKENITEFQDKLRKIPTASFPSGILEWEKGNGLDAGELSREDRLFRMVSTKDHMCKYFSEALQTQLLNNNILDLPTGGRPTAKPFNLEQLKGFAEKGSQTALKMQKALTHFKIGLALLESESSKNEAIHHIAECYRIEPLVAFWSQEIGEFFMELVEQRLSDAPKNEKSSLDRDLHLCYAHLAINNLQDTVTFLDKAIAKYPDDPYFYDIQVDVFGFLREYEEGLRRCKAALKLFPNFADLLYAKAKFHSDIKNRNSIEIIRAYEDFLRVAETDHRQVPVSHYAIASEYGLMTCSCPENKKKRLEFSKLMMKHYMLGLESEKSQLPCFLPHNSEEKSMLIFMMEMQSLSQNQRFAEDCATESETTNQTLTEPVPGVEAVSLTDPRMRIIKDHRQMMSHIAKRNVVYRTPLRSKNKQTPKRKTVNPSHATGLNAITLRDMNPNNKFPKKGSALKLTSIEDAIIESTFIRLVVEDENNDVQRCHVYNFPDEDQEEIQKKFGFGCKFTLVDPEMKMMEDGKPAIRVDYPMSQVLHSERDVKMCRFCGKGDSSRKCSSCRKTFYCSKECQIQDWKLLNHKLICSPPQ